MTRASVIFGLAGVIAASLCATAFAADEDTAAIVGGDSTIFGLTGLVESPEAYTAGPDEVVLGVAYLNNNDNDFSAFVPTLVFGVDDRLEFGAFGQFIQEGTSDDDFGVSAKFKFYDERRGTDIAIADEAAGGGYPSMAGWYTYQDTDAVRRHQLGLTGSWTFLDNPLEIDDDENNTGTENLSNTTLTLGASYQILDTDAASTIPENTWGWYGGINLAPAPEWNVVLEYNVIEEDSLDEDGFAGALRYHWGSPNPDEAAWMVQAGVVNNDNLLVGAQVTF
ncbi:MAG: hypothetical protein ABI743_01390 [bacterium]